MRSTAKGGSEDTKGVSGAEPTDQRITGQAADKERQRH